MTVPLPKEHGSWVMFSFPFLIGTLVAQQFPARLLLLAVAALGFYLMRYPLATLVKTRKRPSPARKELWIWAAVYAALAAVFGVATAALFSLWWLLPMGAFGGALVAFNLWLVMRRQEMSAIGELSGIVGLAMGAPMAYYTATGTLDGKAWLLWLICGLYFGGTVFYVKLKVRQQPRQSSPEQLSARLRAGKASLLYHTTALAVATVLSALKITPPWLPMAFIPVVAKAWVGAWQWQDRKTLNLKRIGLVELAHSTIFALVVVFIFL